MPPRWPRKPDRANDPAYRKLEDRINFAVHVAAFAAVNSGLWFFHQVNPLWVPWVLWVTVIWGGGLLAHAAYIFSIADYSDPVA
ncbi:MAG: 2TM domain-containing protein [Leptolyngbyaceae cyanobacterium SM1_1_3]|nr:2TM domain-containing protein [Leptolyngbyaceae cyanobacterium SM1_1_3]NJM85783.1 2TM domain-containing protein [Leptolyngbyaceae cyanobacterium RM2_2_21]NJN02469.1 2TM domain-containing protein [Leptolyngbyaceae cyanobacterium RM1_1_2]NJO10184.1 2TM domain-containing protein [Leptolyngbyaceae cyanobacterium SL_1_1]